MTYSDADSIPGREPRIVAASIFLN